MVVVVIDGIPESGGGDMNGGVDTVDSDAGRGGNLQLLSSEVGNVAASYKGLGATRLELVKYPPIMPQCNRVTSRHILNFTIAVERCG